jgi:hypothetical protein
MKRNVDPGLFRQLWGTDAVVLVTWQCSSTRPTDGPRWMPRSSFTIIDSDDYAHPPNREFVLIDLLPPLGIVQVRGDG